MLRVGLTGGLGSGKTTAAHRFAELGAHVLYADEIGRVLTMRSDSGVREAIVARFGPEVLKPNGSLDNTVLARIAFVEGRVEELNAIVHPAVLAREAVLIEDIAAQDADAVVLVESALIFETKHGGKDGWRSRFDRIVLVTAPEEMRIERYIQRMSGLGMRRASHGVHAGEARRRMSYQLPEEEKIAMSDFVLTNNGSLDGLRAQVDALWPILHAEATAKERRD